MEPLKIFVGWDSREDIAYQACKQSILEHASVPVDIIPLKQRELRKKQYYWRDEDKLASTEFTFTRFLIPELMKFNGWALFVDCDFIFVEDVKNLFDQVNDKYAIMCAQHDYTPKEGIKMDGQKQTIYPRKNWSSMMLINCSHPKNKECNLTLVNHPNITGAYLHRFSWVPDKFIGEISHEWNWLVGWYQEPKDGKPRALHYTEGGPWFKEYQNCEYANEYYIMERKYLLNEIENQKKKLENEKQRPKYIRDLALTEEKKVFLEAQLENLIDPNEVVFETKNVIKTITENNMGIKVAALAPEIKNEPRLKLKGHSYDPYLKSFVLGSGGSILDFNLKEGTDKSLVIRGLGGGSQKAIKYCIENNIDFYAIDTGYIQPSSKKEYHRVTKNNLQKLGKIIDQPLDRLSKLNWQYREPDYITEGKKILICPPSEKVMKFYNQNLDDWMNETLDTIKSLTNREIEIRLKPSRTERVTNNSIWQALDNAYCLVTYNSIAATEAILYSVPAIALAPNAASSICNTDLKDINNLYLPSKHEITRFAAHLSYCQFTSEEMSNGFAWKYVQ